MTLGYATVACLSLVWLAAACSPIRCPDDRIAFEQGCHCPEGTIDDGNVCRRDMAAPGGNDDGGGFDSTGQRRDGGARDASAAEGGAPGPTDGATPGPSDGGAPSGNDAGSGPPAPPPVDDDDAGSVQPPAPPMPPGPTPEPSCVERCPSRQCDGARCLECVSDRDCSGGAHCTTDNRCVACTSNDHCGAGRECSAERTCVTAAQCPDGRISGTEQCEIGIGWYTNVHCLPSCSFRFWSLCGAGGACPGGQRCFQGVCAPEPCAGRGTCQHFNNLVEGFDTYCPSLPDNPPRLVSGVCLPRCDFTPCPATLTCINGSYCAAIP
ncbi:MAG: hypothetical protein ABW252_00950 [Polyangiales bacterium]